MAEEVRLGRDGAEVRVAGPPRAVRRVDRAERRLHLLRERDGVGGAAALVGRLVEELPEEDVRPAAKRRDGAALQVGAVVAVAVGRLGAERDELVPVGRPLVDLARELRPLPLQLAGETEGEVDDHRLVAEAAEERRLLLLLAPPVFGDVEAVERLAGEAPRGRELRGVEADALEDVLAGRLAVGEVADALRVGILRGPVLPGVVVDPRPDEEDRPPAEPERAVRNRRPFAPVLAEPDLARVAVREPVRGRGRNAECTDRDAQGKRGSLHRAAVSSGACHAQKNGKRNGGPERWLHASAGS